MKNEKKEWKKPELTILVRTRPEESILGTCKQLGVAFLNTATFNYDCMTDDGFGVCINCTDLAAS